VDEARGQKLISRPGKFTYHLFNCFYRGADGETGGRRYHEGTESELKDHRINVEVENQGDSYNEALEPRDIKEFLDFKKIEAQDRLLEQGDSMA
jgi:hypothetical protein